MCFERRKKCSTAIYNCFRRIDTNIELLIQVTQPNKDEQMTGVNYYFRNRYMDDNWFEIPLNDSKNICEAQI